MSATQLQGSSWQAWLVSPAFAQFGSRPGADGLTRFQLLVMAPWCPDCAHEGPALTELAREREAEWGPLWRVLEFAPSAESERFERTHGWLRSWASAQTWVIESSRDAKSLAHSPLTRIRPAFGDERRFGVPSLLGVGARWRTNTPSRELDELLFFWLLDSRVSPKS